MYFGDIFNFKEENHGKKKDKIEYPKKNNYTSITTHLMCYMLLSSS